jgi:hypothetical protein
LGLIQSASFRLFPGNSRQQSKARGLLRKQRPILWRMTFVSRRLLKDLRKPAMLGRPLEAS